jgi:hypothetical protein
MIPEYVTIARKAKCKNEWYVGGITDEQPRIATVNFNFLPKNQKFELTIYEDGKDASFDKNPESFNIRKIKITSKTILKEKVAPGGGFAMRIVQQ